MGLTSFYLGKAEQYFIRTVVAVIFAYPRVKFNPVLKNPAQMHLDYSVMFLLFSCLNDWVCPLYLCLNVFSVRPKYTFSMFFLHCGYIYHAAGLVLSLERTGVFMAPASTNCAEP